MCAATPIQPQTKPQIAGFKNILIPTDFSEASRRAVRYALALARQHHSEVHLVHVIPERPREPIPLDSLPKELDRRRLDAKQGLKHLLETLVIGNLAPRLWIEEGPISDILAAIIKSQDIDLLVFSTHGHGGLRKLVQGSAAEEMLRSVACPVLTLGNKAALAAGVPTFGQVLFATDFGAGATKAAPLVFALAEKCKSRLTLLHIVQPIPILETRSVHGTPANLSDEFVTWEDSKEDVMFRRLKELIPAGVQLVQEPNYVVVSDSPAHGILRAAAEHNAGLIVMGANRAASARTAAHIPWAVAHQVICEATCPVLTVRG
jgi:universal stress protein A